MTRCHCVCVCFEISSNGPLAHTQLGFKDHSVQVKYFGRLRLVSRTPILVHLSRTWQPKLAAAALFEGFQSPLSPLAILPRVTPLSFHGPLFQGSLLSFSTIPAHKLALVGHLRLGAQALSMPVFSLGRRDAHRNRVDDEDHDPRKRFVLKWTNCPLCGIAPLGVFHLACICTSPLLIDWRNHIIPDARRLLINISSLLSEAHSNMWDTMCQIYVTK
jgi:hypothetical protein